NTRTSPDFQSRANSRPASRHGVLIKIYSGLSAWHSCAGTRYWHQTRAANEARAPVFPPTLRARSRMRQVFDSDDGSPPPTHLSPKAVLRHNYLFRALSDATLDGIAALAVKRTYYKGSVIFSQGDHGDALFGVAS